MLDLSRLPAPDRQHVIWDAAAILRRTWDGEPKLIIIRPEPDQDIEE